MEQSGTLGDWESSHSVGSVFKQCFFNDKCTVIFCAVLFLSIVKDEFILVV